MVLGYRFILAAYCIAWLIYTATLTEFVMIEGKNIPWPAFLTNWTYFTLTLYLTLHFVACVVYTCRRGGNCCSSPSVEDHCNLFHELQVEPSLWVPRDYEYVQGSPELDGEVHVSASSFSISILLKVVWILFNIASCMCVMVTILFWIFLWPMMSDNTDEFGFMINFQLHAVTSIILILEHVVSAVPIRLNHYLFSAAYGVIYVTFSLIYYAVDKTVIYPVILDWSKPGFPVAVVVVTCFVVGPLMQLFFFAIYKLKLYIFSEINQEQL